MKNSNEPYALKCEDEKKRRDYMLNEAHMTELTKFVNEIRAAHPELKKELIPDFDPCDGGVNAKALFVLEAPGPKAVASGFISRNNPDPTARNFCNLLEEAQIARKDTILWNIVPWYIGNEERTKIRAANSRDKANGVCYLNRLIEKLPKLQIVVFVGAHAQSQQGKIVAPAGIEFFHTPHPSAQCFNLHENKEKDMKEQLKKIAESLR